MYKRIFLLSLTSSSQNDKSGAQNSEDNTSQSEEDDNNVENHDDKEKVNGTVSFMGRFKMMPKH